MSTDRRFSEREIREVFERAAAEQDRAAQRHADDGLTLAEMQEVGASAGIAPEFVAAAARSVALGEPEEGRMMLGPVPRGVFRTEFLPGPPTDALWAHVLADARRTFSAQGKVSEGGGVREWRNGNLRVTLEKAGDGSRLHLRTRRDEVVQLSVIAAMAALLGVVVAVFSTTNAGFDPDGLGTWLMMALGGTAGAASIWARQRTWAATRERQMAEIAERAAAASQAAGLSEASPVEEPPVAPVRPAARLDLDALPDPEDAGAGSRSGRGRTRS